MANPHYPKHRAHDRYRHPPGQASSVPVTNDSGTDWEEVPVQQSAVGGSIARRGDATASLEIGAAIGPSDAITNEQARYRIQRVTAVINSDDLTASAGEQDIDLETHVGVTPWVPANALIVGCLVETIAEWVEGTGVADLSAQVGDAAAFDQLLDATVITDVGTHCERGDEQGQCALEAAYQPTVRFSSTVDLDTYTAGASAIHILYISTADL